jgi:hypothetical protein
MAKKKFLNKLIDIRLIDEEILLIDGTDDEYISENGNVYRYYGDNKMYKKKTFINPNNGYLYVNIKMSNGKTKQKRVHKLVAIAFIPNPNNYNVVMHLDDNKANPKKDNLKWGTVSENTKDAFEKGLAYNDKGFDDSQSFPVCVFNLKQELKHIYGSVSIASIETGVTKTGILYQCNHKVKNIKKKPKCNLYFRFLDEYNKKGFVL